MEFEQFQDQISKKFGLNLGGYKEKQLKKKETVVYNTVRKEGKECLIIYTSVRNAEDSVKCKGFPRPHLKLAQPAPPRSKESLSAEASSTKEPAL